MTTNNRIEYMDIAKALCMMMVIFVHAYAEYPVRDIIVSQLNNYITSFFMPAFFIFSGLFIKRQRGGEFIRNKSKTLLTPLMVFYLLGYLASFVVSNMFHVSLHNEFEWNNIFNICASKTFSNGALWFLAALFWGLIVVQVFLHISSTAYRWLWIVFVFSVLGLWKLYVPYRMPVYMDSGIYSVLFLLIGYYCKPLLSFLSHSKTIIWSVFISSVIIVYLFMDNKSSMMIVTYHGNFILSVLTGITGSSMIITLSMLINHSPMLSYFGRYSIVSLCVHFFFIKPTVMIFKTSMYSLSETVILIFSYTIIIILCYTGIAVITRYCPFIIGKSKQYEK